MADKDELIKNSQEMVEKINLAQEYAEVNTDLCTLSAFHAAELIVQSVYLSESGTSEIPPYAMMIDSIRQRDILPPEIVETLEIIPAYAEKKAEGTPASASDVLHCLYHLEKTVRWYFQDYLQTEIPAELGKFVILNHDLPTVEASPPEKVKSSEQPAAEENSKQKKIEAPKNAIDFIKQYTVPEYVVQLVEQNTALSNTRDRDLAKRYMDDMNRIYDRLDLKDDIARAIFYMFCLRTLQGKKPVALEPFMESVLKWSGSASAQNIRNFPTTELTVSTAVEKVIGLLENKRLIIDQEYPGYGRLIGLLEEDIQEEQQENETEKRIIDVIKEELRRATEEPDYPYPSFRGVQAQLKGTNINLAEFCPEPVEYQEMDEETLKTAFDSRIISVVYQNSLKDFLLITPKVYLSLPLSAAQKAYQYFVRILPERGTTTSAGVILTRINLLLRKNFPNDNMELATLLAPERIRVAEIWTVNDSNLNYWLFIFKELYECAHTILKINSPEERAVIQAITILYHTILGRRERQQDLEQTNIFKDSLVKEIQATDKMPRKTLQKEWLQKIAKEGTEGSALVEEKFADFLNAFLSEFNLRKKPDGFVIELPIINPRTRQLEYYYVHSANLLGLYLKNLEEITDKQTGIRETAFVRRLTDVLQNNQWSSDSQTIVSALDSDDSFAQYLATYIRDHYNELFVLDRVFEENIEMLSYLIRIKNEKYARFFNPNTSKRQLVQMLGITRLDILKEMKTKDDLFMRLVSFFMSFFPFLQKRLSARMELVGILDEQLKSYGKSGLTRRHEINRAKGDNRKRQEAPKKKILDMLFQSKPLSMGGPQAVKAEKGSVNNDPDWRLRQKIGQFKKELLRKEGFTSEKEYLDHFLKKWSIKPSEDEKIVQELLYKKDVNKNVSWLVSIRRDLNNVKTLDEYFTALDDVAKAMVTLAQKKHIDTTQLAAYLGMYILIAIEKSI